MRHPGVPSTASGPYIVWASSCARTDRMPSGLVEIVPAIFGVTAFSAQPPPSPAARLM
jgi:hypothetical protein